MMDEGKLPDNLMETIWIGVLGKLLVRKGVLTRDEITAELLDIRRDFEGAGQGANAQLVRAELDNAVQTVERW